MKNNSRPDPSDTVIHSERVMTATPRDIFAAFEDPGRLARWWGPKGFTNTFSHFDFAPGGRWKFTMHGPNGADYANEHAFRQIDRDTRIVTEHLSHPRFRLTVTLTPRGNDTHVAWHQDFEDPKVAAALRRMCQSANEEVLDRLQAIAEGR